jgi:hypothetical protein
MEEITNYFNTVEQQMYNFALALSTFSVKLGTVDIEKTNPKMCLFQLSQIFIKVSEEVMF